MRRGRRAAPDRQGVPQAGGVLDRRRSTSTGHWRCWRRWTLRPSQSDWRWRTATSAGRWSSTSTLMGEMWGRQSRPEYDLRALPEVWLTVDSVSAQVDWPPEKEPHGAARYARFSDRFRAYRAWTEASVPGRYGRQRCVAWRYWIGAGPRCWSLTRAASRVSGTRSGRPIRASQTSFGGRMGGSGWWTGKTAALAILAAHHQVDLSPRRGLSARAGGVAGVPGAVPGGDDAARSTAVSADRAVLGDQPDILGCPCCSRRAFDGLSRTGSRDGRSTACQPTFGCDGTWRERWPGRSRTSRGSSTSWQRWSLPRPKESRVESTSAGRTAPSGRRRHGECSRFVAKWALQRSLTAICPSACERGDGVTIILTVIAHDTIEGAF